jgi:hypothetical protein
LTKGEKKVTKIEKVTKIKKSHKDKKLNCKEGERDNKGREIKGSIKIEHKSRRSKLMNYLLHLYVH